MSDDPGLLGNLPRSRPGTRSDKRASSATAKPVAAKASPAKAKPPPPRAQPKAKPRPKVANPKPRPAPETQSPDPVSEALKTAGRLAGAGARTANGVTREILRRLPRP